MADVEYFTVDELAAYPGVAAPPATLALAVDILNALLNDVALYGQLDPVPTGAYVRAKAIGLAVAADWLSNPENATQRTFQIDDWKETLIFDPDSVRESRTELGFSGDELYRLRLAAGLAQARTSRSIKLGVPGYPTVVC